MAIDKQFKIIIIRHLKRDELKVGELRRKLYKLFEAVGKGKNHEGDGKEEKEENIKSSFVIEIKDKFPR